MPSFLFPLASAAAVFGLALPPSFISAAISPAASPVPFPRAITAAISTTEVAAIAEQVTVRIDGQSPGSGVLFAKQGQTYFVLTAAHVVATPDEYDVITPDGQKHRLNYAQVKRLAGADLAIVQFNSSRPYTVAKLGDSSQLRRGMTTYVAGWPATGSDLTRNNLQFQPGLISAISQTQQDNGYGLVYSNNTLPGMSGGAVLNDQGELIGIHGRGEAERLQQTDNTEVVVKLGFNQGVPINTFLALAPSSGLRLGLRTVQPLAPVVAAANRNVDDLYVQGINFTRVRNYREALKVFDEAIQLDGKDARLYVSRGNARANLRQIEPALADFNQALQLDPKDTHQAYLYRGNVYFALGRFSNALSDYNQGIQLRPSGALYLQRAKVFERLNNRLQAISDTNQAIRLQPLLADAYSRRGILLVSMGTPGERLRAMNDFNQAIRLDFRNADAYYGRAGLQAQQGNRPQALSDYQRASQFYMMQGDFEMHRKVMQQMQMLR
jgi:tetratricopeptide (TPR) repeat protein